MPVIVLIESGSFVDRVELARLGARAFLSKPVAPGRLVDAVVEVLDRVPRRENTVLAIDDDPAIVAAVDAILSQEGFRVVGLTDPSQFWQVLERTAPDLLVLDVDMPAVSGVDLCRVVRADARWSHLPIVFLTGARSPDLVRSVFAAGADDYVTKPVVGPELVVRISNRLERLRLYQRLAETDPLTGTANRRKGGDELNRFLLSAQRHREPLAVALLDLDLFKQVNDLRGHPAGDAVLRKLAATLREAFRGADVVSRWGGEEFLVGMYGMHRLDAVQRVAEVLEEFRQHEFRDAGHTPFRVTFSAGVASYPDDGADLPTLYQTADDVLYAAKAAGRNRVLAAGSAAGATDIVDVVLVEDDQALAPLLLHALETRGLTTRWLQEGDRAAKDLAGPSPDIRARVIVLDWDLPGLDGPAILSRLAHTGVLGQTHVIMLTGRSRESEVLTALELGAVDHVAKPFSVPVLIARIRRWLATERRR